MKKEFVCIIIAALSLILMDATTHQYKLLDPIVSYNDGFCTITSPECEVYGVPGEPSIPYFGFKLLLPFKLSASTVKVIKDNAIEFTLEAPIQPLQRELPLSYRGEYSIVEPDTSIYNSSDVFPKSNVIDCSTWYLSGHSIAMGLFSPFEYYPLQSKLLFYRDITVIVDEHCSDEAAQAYSLIKEDPFITKRLLESVDNKDIVPKYHTQRNDGYEYLMLVDGSKITNWQPLVDYYSSKGMSVQIKSVSEIMSNTTGIDSQDKLRNYIKDVYIANPLRYVLLGGDTNIIPHRGMYVNLGANSQVDNDIPTDMYYSCLDGTWNTDNDQYWGEFFEADLIPEIAIGRICYNSDAEIANQINKIIAYQQYPIESEIKKALFVGEWLWEGPTWGGDYMDEMIGGSSVSGYSTIGIPTTWDITTLYDRTYGYEDAWGPSQIRPLLSQGSNFVNHLGHSSTTYNMRLSNNQASSTTITNNGTNGNFSLYFSQGCYAGSFDNRETYEGLYTSDCFTEKLTSLPTGAVGMISHSRYGWGTQGSTNGASQRFHRQYIDAIFGESIHEYGYTLVDSKVDNIPYINNSSVNLWVAYETNLFGCPALKVWSDIPQTIIASLQNNLVVGTDTYQITTNASNARIRVRKGESIIFEGYSNEQGLCVITFDPPITPGMHTIFIEAANFYAYSEVVYATASQMPYIVSGNFSNTNQSFQTDDIIEIGFQIKNIGLVDQVSSGTIMLSSTSENIQILSGAISFSPLTAGDSLFVENAFRVQIVGNFPDNSFANLSFIANYDGYTTESTARIHLTAPNLQLIGYNLSSPQSIIHPGDTVSINLTISNIGAGRASFPLLIPFSDTPYITIPVFDVPLSGIDPGETVVCNNAFTVNISNTVELGSILTIGFIISAENGVGEDGTMLIPIGVLTYSFEIDMQGWSTAQLDNNYANQWHRSSQRNFSPNGLFSMKFGGQGSAQYTSSGYGSLISPEISIVPNSILKFHHFMDAERHNTNTTYAWDGGLVQISMDGGPWTQIIPNGAYPYRIYSNSASPFAANTPVYSGQIPWSEAIFDLGTLSGVARFRFIFGSDAYTNGEGWYIDDVYIERPTSILDDTIGASPKVVLYPNFPNPFNPSTNISFCLSDLIPVTLCVYNIKGQLVRTLIDSVSSKGITTVIWDGKDNKNLQVGSGLYYAKLSYPDGAIVHKMIMIK